MFSWWNRNKEKDTEREIDEMNERVARRFACDDPIFYGSLIEEIESCPNRVLITGKPTQHKINNGENEMKTDKQTQIAILKRVIENIESGKNLKDGIQFMGFDGAWTESTSVHGDALFGFYDTQYRLTPKTITLANGVVIPEPLSANDLKQGFRYYIAEDCNDLYSDLNSSVIRKLGCRFIYATKEEAIAASKALFGID